MPPSSTRRRASSSSPSSPSSSSSSSPSPSSSSSSSAPSPSAPSAPSATATTTSIMLLILCARRAAAFLVPSPSSSCGHRGVGVGVGVGVGIGGGGGGGGGGLWRHAGTMSNTPTARCLFSTPTDQEKSMSSDQERVGFIGLGIMGDCMARNLIKGGRDVVVWNRTRSKAVDFSRQTGCQTAGTPREVVEKCDITYSMLSTPEAVAKVFFDPEDGVLAGLSEGKNFVDCATLQAEDMQGMYRAANSKGAKFLESPVSGSKGPAANGQLVFLCGGDRDLYDRVANDLHLMGKASHYLGPAGKATEMKLVVNMIMATMLASVAEGICLSESLGLSNDALIEILGQGAMASPLIALKGPLMNKRDYSLTFALKHALKDMHFALDLGVKAAQALPLASATNAEYMRAKGRHANDDFCSVIEALRSKP